MLHSVVIVVARRARQSCASVVVKKKRSFTRLNDAGTDSAKIRKASPENVLTTENSGKSDRDTERIDRVRDSTLKGRNSHSFTYEYNIYARKSANSNWELSVLRAARSCEMRFFRSEPTTNVVRSVSLWNCYFALRHFVAFRREFRAPSNQRARFGRIRHARCPGRRYVIATIRTTFRDKPRTRAAPV